MRRHVITILFALALLLSCSYALGESGEETLESYEGGGLFQCGSFSGPQTVEPAEFDEALVSSDAIVLLGENVGSTRNFVITAASSDAILYDTIYAAMSAQSPQFVTMGGKTVLGVSLGSFAYAKNNANKNIIYYAYAKAVNDHPSLFYYLPDVLFGITDDNTITSLYMVVNADALNSRDAYEAELGAMLAQALPDTSGMSQSEIALALHDYIVLHTRYNYSVPANETAYSTYPNVFSVYGVVIDKMAVCHGLSLAYKEMLNRVGINACIVADYADGHAWNMVELDGKWYHADLTYANGSLPSGGDPDQDKDLLGYVRHDRFLLSDSEQGSYFASANWSTDALPAAPSSHPNAIFWQNICSGMLYVDGNWYYNTGSYSFPARRSSGGLMRGKYGADGNVSVMYTNVSFPVLLKDKLYFFDFSDNALYAFSPILHRRFARRSFAFDCIGEMGAGHIKPSSLNVEDGYIYYVMSSSASTFTVYAKDDLGDANLDATVDIKDVLRVARHVQNARRYPLEAGGVLRADVNWNQTIDASDAQGIAQIITGLAV